MDKSRLKKYQRGPRINIQGIKTTINKKKLEVKEKNIKFAQKQSALAEVLLTEDSGYLEADAGETTTQFTQDEIVKNVDITAATKHFDLRLTDFGPYRCNYTKNGRHLLLGGKMGHVAAFDWVTKKLHCELNVMESVFDVSWLHIETMFAVAQKSHVYIYDNQGIELHCIKRLNRVTRMEFLPYHFLLGACSEEGYLSWLDISVGKLAGQYNTKLGRLTMLAQNPYNAVLCLGHAKGVVSMWSPTCRDPLAKMFCHKAPMTALHVNPSGRYMVTAACNREVKIWDVRKLEGPLQEYKVINAATNVALSQKNMLAMGMGNIVEVYRDCCTQPAKRAYLRHRFNTPISNFNFTPYEDILGVGTAKGFTSLIVPGAGEPNFDALETNPYQSKQQRREREVKSLLEKIQPELICLNPILINSCNTGTQEKVEKSKLGNAKPPKIHFEPKNKGKGSVQAAKSKKIVKELAKREFIKNLVPSSEAKKSDEDKPKHVLDRFRSK